jgi:hypothetical protein
MNRILSLLCLCFLTLPGLARTSPQPRQSASGLYGYADESGKFVIEARFEEALTFVEGVARVKQQGFWGLIDEKGNFRTPPRYTEIQPFRYGVAMVSLARDKQILYGLLDASGKEIIPPQYLHFNPDYSYQLFITALPASENQSVSLRFGVINRQNQAIIPLNFKEIRHSRYRTFAARQANGNWQFFEASGKNLFGGIYQSISDFDETFAIVQEPTGWGMTLPSGEKPVKPVYRQILRRSAVRFDLLRTAEKKVLDERGNLLFATPLPGWQYLGENRYCFQQENQLRLAEADGKLVGNDSFETMQPFHNGLAIVSRATGKGVINLRGQNVLPCHFNQVFTDSLSGLIQADSADRWQVFHRSGKRFNAESYDQIRFQPYGMLTARQGNLWQVIDAYGKPAGKEKYDQLSDFQDLHAIASQKNLFGVIDTRSQWLVEPVFDSLKILGSHLVLGYVDCYPMVVNVFSKKLRFAVEKVEPLPGNYFFRITVKGKQGIIDQRGKIIIAPQYQQVSGFLKDSIFTVTLDGNCGLVNLRGNTVLTPNPEWTDMQMMSEHWVGTRIGNRFGFLDNEGRVRISNRYQDVQTLSEGRAGFKLQEKWGFLNLDEEIVVQPQYQAVRPFAKGLAQVQKQKRWGLVNRQGREVIRPQFDTLRLLRSGLFISEFSGRKGLIAAEGGELLPAVYEVLEPVNAYLFLAKKGGKYGLFNGQGQEVVPILYDRIEKVADRFLLSQQPVKEVFDLNRTYADKR